MKTADIKVPEVGLLDFLGCATKSGRQSLARKLITPFAKVDSISALVTEGFTAVVNSGVGKLSDARCAEIASGCKAVKACCSTLINAVDPEGDGGKNITQEEKALVKVAVNDGIHKLLKQESVNSLVDRVVEKIP